jgi:hypothetical protein
MYFFFLPFELAKGNIYFFQVPSPIHSIPFDGQFLSGQNSPSAEGTFDFGHHYNSSLNALDDPMLYGEENKEFGDSMDFDNTGIFGDGNIGNSLEWPDHSHDFVSLEPIGADVMGIHPTSSLPFHTDDLSSDFLLSDF